MWGKVLIFSLGLAVGWVLGARNGRGAYERLADGASDAWRSPAARRAREATKDAVGRIPRVGDAAVDGLELVGDRVEEHTDRHGSSD
jgi:hypothetical protein